MGDAKLHRPAPVPAQPQSVQSAPPMTTGFENAPALRLGPPVRPPISWIHAPQLLAEEDTGDFLALLRHEISQMAEQELRGTDWTVDHCPYLEYWFAYYAERSPGDIEAALRRYAPGATTARVSADYVPFVVERVRRAIRHWRVTGSVDAPSVPDAESTPAEIEARFPDAQPLPSDTRTRMEDAFERDLQDVRVHAAGDGLERVGETSARALTVGSTIVFGRGQFDPGSTIGDLLLAHELAHTQQQSHAATTSSTPSADEHQADQLAAAAVARTRGLDAKLPVVGARRGLSLRRCNNFAPPAPEDAAIATEATTPDAGPLPTTVPDIDDGVVYQNKDDDFFLAESNGNVIALPAKNLVYELLVKPTEISAQNIFGIPTADKEGVRLVNIGGRESFLIESGGRPVALMPEAMRLLKEALNVSEIVGINTLHIHEDHIRNLISFIIRYNIKPEGLRFPRAFTTSGMRFATIIQQLQNLRGLKPDQMKKLKALGYGRGAATPFTIWDVPASAKFGSYRIGDKMIEEYGDPQAFARVARGAQSKPSSPELDAASVILRITDIPSGKRVVVFSDPRGMTLADLRTQLGDQKFGEIFQGVTVISGFQHHTGSLHTPDHEGVLRVLIEILSRNGQLTILEQSTTAPRRAKGGGPIPFMNASLIEALHQLGITHIAGLAPANAQSLGTITVDRNANVQTKGNSISTSTGDPQVAARFQRFVELDNAIRVMRENVDVLGQKDGSPVKDRIVDLEAARLSLGRALGLLPQASGVYDGLLQTVIAGVGTGQAHGAAALTNQANVNARKAAALAKHAGEAFLEQNAQFVQYLALQGNILRSAYRGILDMRRTGQVTEKLIRDLVLLDPELARRLLDTGNVNRSMRDILKAEIKDANDYKRSSTPRAVAKGMLVMTAWNEILVPWGTTRQMDKETELNKFRNVLSWWRERGVQPAVDASDNSWFDSDTRSDKTRVVNEMMRQDMIDHLVVTKIEGEENWDQFNIWIGTNVHNIDDYVRLVRDKPARWCSALRMVGGDFATAHWEYRAGTLSADTVSDYTVTEKWLSHPRLDIIMQAMATRIMATTEQQLTDAWVKRQTPKPGDQSGQGVGTDEDATQAARVMLGNRKIERRVRFSATASDRRAFTVGKQSRVIQHIPVVENNGWWSEPEFYVLPASEDPLNQADIDSDFLLVTGADWNTYAQLTTVYRVGQELDGSSVRKVNLRGNPRAMVLIKKSSVEDF